MTPRLADRSRSVDALWWLGAVACVLYAASTVVPGLRPSDAAVTVWDTGVYCAIMAIASALTALRGFSGHGERAAWLAMAAGMAVSAIAELYWALALAGLDEPPYPSLADALWLSSYLGSYAGMVLLVRSRVARFHASMWLDGIVCGLAAAAVIAAVAFDSILSTTGGTVAVVATNLAYPIADLLLVFMAIAVIGLTGGRPGRSWTLLGLSLLITGIADTIYLFEAAKGTYLDGSWLSAFWPLGAMLSASAAWRPSTRHVVRLDDWRVLVIPSAATLVALAVLVACGVGQGRSLAVLLAAAGVAIAVARTQLTFREVRHLAATRRLAMTDDLTGLPNRRALLHDLELTAAAAGGGALLLVDLDHFKELNDTLGHPVGDSLLRAIGPRLRPVLRRSDVLARLGGDEFAILQRGPLEPDEALATAERVRGALEDPFELDGFLAQIEGSIGIALAPAHGASATDLLQRADVAMYRAKREATGAELYAPEYDTHSRDRVSLLPQLRRGLDRGELELHFQPQVDLATGRTVAVEALARWRHPVRGLLFPDAFLPAVERTSVMRPFTDRLVHDALHAGQAWRAAGLDLPVAINLAAPNLLDAHLPRRLAGQLAAAGARPGDLRLEVTETAVMVDLDRSRRLLYELRALGFHLALDDFGTGHSSLANLEALPIDELKIDRSFVMTMAADPRKAAIVRSVLALARALDLQVVAEGVETIDAYAELAGAGCHRAQGFLLSRPIPAGELLPWTRAWTPPTAARLPADTGAPSGSAGDGVRMR